MTALESQGKNSVTIMNDRELRLERIFDAPRELVWLAWTDPHYLMKWWGPENFTAPVCKLDFRIDGRYLFCMRSPEGRDFWSTGAFMEIIPLERIVYTDSFADEHGNVVPASYYGMEVDYPLEMQVILTFEALSGNRTRMTLRHFDMPEGDMSEMAGVGWSMSFDKLAETLKAKTILTAEPGKQDLFISRIFNAPVTLVFKAFTDPELIPHWWGPRKYKTMVDRMEVHPGGVWRFLNGDEEGNIHGFHGVYHDIDPGRRIVQTFEYEGAPGYVSLETAVFEALEGGKTRVLTQAVHQSVEARDAMLDSGMEGGMNETMDRLEELLASL